MPEVIPDQASRAMELVYTLIFFGLVVGAFILAGHLVYRFQTLQYQLKQSRKQYDSVVEFLNDFSRSLGTVAEIPHAMQLVANNLCNVLKAESLAIYAVDVDPSDNKVKLRGKAVSGMFPAFHRTAEIVLAKPKYRLEHLQHEFIAFGEGILGHVAHTEQSVLVENTVDCKEWGQLPSRVETLLAVPMHVDNRFVGVVCAVNCREEQRYFNAEDLEKLETLSYQAALASNIVTVYSERSKQERILQELELGREIQQSLLPGNVPSWGEYQFSVFGLPALEVAGDYYDFVEIDENRLMIIVADATGKGVPACMLMAMCRSFVRSLVEHYAGMEKFLLDLNHRLFRSTDKAHFLTMAAVVVDKHNHVCEYGSAGHPPLLLQLPDGITRRVVPQGPALGLLPKEFGVHFDTFSFSFHPGTRLLLFTDGITEALNQDHEEFGMERLQRLWDENDLPPEKMTKLIVSEVKRFAGDEPQADDQTMLIIAR